MIPIKKILIIEDEAITALTMKMQLTDKGYSVCGITATGEDAIELTQAENPDIILMDIQLSGHMNGIDAARTIKEESDIPVIFITGYPDEEILQQAKKINPVAFLVKPVGIDLLLSHFNSIES